MNGKELKASLFAGIVISLSFVVTLFAVPATVLTNLETTGTMAVGTNLTVGGTTVNTGAVTNEGAITNNGDSTFTGDVTHSSTTRHIDVPNASAFELFATSSVPLGSKYLVIKSSGGDITLTPANSLAILSTTTVANGEIYTITSEDADDDIIFTDDGGLSSSGLALGAATRTLSINDVLILRFNGTLWVEQGFTNNQ